MSHENIVYVRRLTAIRETESIYVRYTKGFFVSYVNCNHLFDTESDSNFTFIFLFLSQQRNTFFVFEKQ